jgi:predicted ATPase
MPGKIEKISVKSLEFSESPFRKLKELKVEIGSRLTLIAGHNGIGKSTILGLLANTFGLTSEGAPKTYLGDPFYANIERIVYLALSEVETAQQNPAAAPIVVADVDGVEVRKRCAMTRREAWKRARVVPRTIDRAEDDPIGPDAKIPLACVFLGIRRLASIGEADEKEVSSTVLQMHADDRRLMTGFMDSVIIGGGVTDDMTHQSIRGSKKKTAHPGYQTHEALAVSMGQDSLASIATALASFSQLKREQGDDYAGGLLIIDELDVGFHPHAITRLAEALKSAARKLSLQIVATTHSPALISAVHPEGAGNARSPDKVVYLLDTRRPRLAEDQSLKSVLEDMVLTTDYGKAAKSKKPTLGVYFEDPEGAQFCDALIPKGKRSALGRKYGVTIKLIPLGVGGSNLIGLPDKDPIFKDRVLIVDADTTIPLKAAARGNTIKLPCQAGSRGTARSPENTIIRFLQDIVERPTKAQQDAMLRFDVPNPTSDKIANQFLGATIQSTQRESTKGWWKEHWNAIQRWGVLREWAICYPREAEDFVASFEQAVARTAARFV